MCVCICEHGSGVLICSNMLAIPFGALPGKQLSEERGCRKMSPVIHAKGNAPAARFIHKGMQGLKSESKRACKCSWHNLAPIDREAPVLITANASHNVGQTATVW